MVRRLAKPVPRCVGAPVILAADMHARFFTLSAGNSASSNTMRFLATMNSLIGGVMMTVTVVFLSVLQSGRESALHFTVYAAGAGVPCM